MDMRTPLIIGIVAVVAAGFASALYISHLDLPLLLPAGPVATGERDVMIMVVALAAIAVVPAYILLYLFAFMFREGNTAWEHWRLPEWDHYGRIAEIVWWLVPTLIMVALSFVAWETSHSLDPYQPIEGNGPPLEVQVVSLTWKWLFIYPAEDVALLNQLVIPVGRPVHFTLTADAPMNSFWIPALAGQVMVMPGMSTQLWLRADRAGTFDGWSGNLSGEGFASMRFDAAALLPADFDAWMTAAASSSQPLSDATYHVLSAPSSADPASAFSPVSPGLYGRVVESYMMAGMQNRESMPAMEMSH